MKIKNLKDMIRAKQYSFGSWGKNVLLKGGHKKTKYIEDVLLNNKKEIKIFKNKKIRTKNTHGTGCTLSSAVATFSVMWKTSQRNPVSWGIKYVNQA